MHNVFCNVNIVYALEMGQMVISLLRTFDGFPRTNFEWICLHSAAAMLPIPFSTVSIPLHLWYTVYTAWDRGLYIHCSLFPSKHNITAKLLRALTAQSFAPANWLAWKVWTITKDSTQIKDHAWIWDWKVRGFEEIVDRSFICGRKTWHSSTDTRIISNKISFSPRRCHTAP